MNLSLTVFLGMILAINGLPSFEWVKERYSSSGIPLLTVRFPNGEEDHAVFAAVNPIPQQESERSEDVDSCIFSGYLQNEPESTVTLAGGCPFDESFEILIGSERLDGLMYKVESGVVRILESPYKHMSKDNATSKLIPPIETDTTFAPSSRIALPSAGFIAKVNILYDQLFKKKLGADSINAIRRIMAFVQDMFRLSSLTTTVRFNIANIQESSISVVGGASDANLKTVSNLSTDKSYNGNIVLTFDNNNYGTTGIAWTGSVCSTPYWRTSLSEYFFTEGQTAQVLAHEFGHNLGMGHDFGDNRAPRSDKGGKSCTNIKSIMDYDQDYYNKWSTCSVQDFTDNFNKNQPYCLASDNGSLGTITPTTPAPTTKGNPCLTTAKESCAKLCASPNAYSCNGSLGSETFQCPCTLYRPAGK